MAYIKPQPLRTPTSYQGGHQIGLIKAVDGHSIALNNQKQEGGEKPIWTGPTSPNDTHPGGPSMPGHQPVPMPK